MLIHVVDAAQKGIRKVATSTVECVHNDVVVLVVASLNNINPHELWTALGT